MLGEPARVLRRVDPDSDLADRVAETGTAVVELLTWPDRDLPRALPGPHRRPAACSLQADFVDTEWGPRLAHATTWAGVGLEGSSEVGWSRLLTCVVEHLEVGDDTDPMHAPPRAVGAALTLACATQNWLPSGSVRVAQWKDPTERRSTSPGPRRRAAVDLGVEVVGPQVDVDPVFARGGVVDLLERHLHRPARHDDEEAAGLVVDLAAQLVGPPLGEGDGVGRVDGDGKDAQGHARDPRDPDDTASGHGPVVGFPRE